MSEQLSMDSILSDKPAEPPVVEAPQPQEQQEKSESAAESPAAEPPAAREPTRKQAFRNKEKAAQDAGKVRDPESGKFVAKEPETPAEPAAPAPVVAAAPPIQEMTAKEKALLAAAHDERQKRQELERRIAAMEKPAEPAKTFWDDPEGTLKQFEAKIEGTVLNTRLNTAETIARSRHPDFDEKIAVFAQVLQNTPGLHQQWLSSPDPAEFAFNAGKNHMDFQAFGSLEAMRAKIEADTAARVRAQIEAEYKAKAEEDAKTRAAIPGSLSDARAVQSNRPVWSGPPSMEDILKG